MNNLRGFLELMRGQGASSGWLLVLHCSFHWSHCPLRRNNVSHACALASAAEMIAFCPGLHHKRVKCVQFIAAWKV